MKVALTVWSGGKAGDNFKGLPITIKSVESVRARFERAVKNIGQNSPASTTFLIKVEDNIVGRVGIGSLADRGN